MENAQKPVYTVCISTLLHRQCKDFVCWRFFYVWCLFAVLKLMVLKLIGFEKIVYFYGLRLCGEGDRQRICALGLGDTAHML